MGIFESYKTNGTMRDRFYRMNGIKHAEVWDTDDGYTVALCTARGVGWIESGEKQSIRQCMAWARVHCPELSLLI